MNFRIASLVVMLSLSACAGVPAPETPAQEAPTQRSPQRQPVPRTPSDTPEIVYASAAPRLPYSTETKL